MATDAPPDNAESTLPIYRGRVIGMLGCTIIVGLAYKDQAIGAMPWVVLLAHTFILPHAAYWGGRRLANPPKFEARLMLFESFVAGHYMAAMGFALWPSFATFTAFFMNNILVGGVGMAARALPLTVAGALLTCSFMGFRFHPETSLACTLASIVANLFYIAATSQITKMAMARIRDVKEKLEEAGRQMKAKTIELEAAQEMLTTQNVNLQELDRQKTHFFQNVSHELRTPLTLILNPLDELIQERPGDSRLAVASRNARRLLRLVNQLLEFQKLAAGKRTVLLKPLDLQRLLAVCADMFRSTCSGRGVVFAVDCPEGGESLLIDGEVDALEKVIFNYLSNALKYTPRGGNITLGLLATESRVRIEVRDTGPGISAEGQKKLFRVFSQVDESTTREFEGTGLGLALTKQLAESMGGTVGVDSLLGEGSTFWAEFPRSLGDRVTPDSERETNAKTWLLADHENGVPSIPPPRPPPSSQPEGSSPSPLSPRGPSSAPAHECILVVDDLHDMRALIARALSRAGYDVLTASDGAEGVRIARERRPDLIVTDWMMPRMSGPDLIRELKADLTLRTTPVILLTAKSDEESKILGTGIGADAFLGKPFNEQELVSAARNLLRLKAKEHEVEALNRYLTESVLKRYLPHDLVKQVVDGGLLLDEAPKSQEVTVLFSDIVEYTRMTSDLGAAKTSRLLNVYLDAMIEVIFSHGGTIDKFIGDAIMVIFGAPVRVDPRSQIESAARCALAMHAKLEQLSDRWTKEGLPRVRMRIGIHQGTALVGNFGNEKRSDFTAIGDAVNLASRIEHACEAGGVYISRAASANLPDGAATPAGLHALKGIGDAVPLYQLVPGYFAGKAPTSSATPHVTEHQV